MRPQPLDDPAQLRACPICGGRCLRAPEARPLGCLLTKRPDGAGASGTRTDIEWPAPLASSDEFSLTTGARVGGYRLVRIVGRGGAGLVFEGSRSGEPSVAIKLLRRHAGGTRHLVQRFEREAAMLASLSHPNIVRIHRWGVQDGLRFLVMEYVRGTTLRQRMRPGRLPLPAALDCMAQTCRALAFAHAHGIVHRDVKPENVLLDPDGRVKVVDFGLSAYTCHARPAMNEAQSLTGTPAYMAPERRTGTSPVDPSADLYSVGVMLVELLTGRLPVSGEPLVATLRALDLAPPVRQLAHNLLHANPADRSPAAAVVAERLATAAATYARERT